MSAQLLILYFGIWKKTYENQLNELQMKMSNLANN